MFANTLIAGFRNLRHLQKIMTKFVICAECEFQNCKPLALEAGWAHPKIVHSTQPPMKKIVILCLFISIIQARADMVITESVASVGQTQTMTLKIKGDKVRTDISEQLSTIMDTASGDLITIMHAQKSYMKISGSKSKELIEQMKKLQGQTDAADTPAEKPKLVDTGKSEKVNDYNAEIYTSQTPTMKITLWVTKDFPNYAAVSEQMKKLQADILGKLGSAANGTPDISGLQGLPVKTQYEINGNTVTVTILSAKEQPVDDAEMTVPSGYTEMAMPNFGGADAPKP